MSPLRPCAAVRSLRDPVVVVRGASVVTELSVFPRSTDPNQKDGAVLFAENVFALLGGGMGMRLDHVVRGGKEDIFGEDGRNAKLLGNDLLGVVDSLVDLSDGVFEVVNVAIFRGDDLLPVPLVNVERVGEVDIVVATETTEIRHDSVPGLDFVVVLNFGGTK